MVVRILMSLEKKILIYEKLKIYYNNVKLSNILKQELSLSLKGDT